MTITQEQYDDLLNHVQIAQANSLELVKTMPLNPYAVTVHASICWAVHLLDGAEKEAANGEG